MYYVYILCLNNGQLYVGSTNDLRRRMEEHRAGKSSFTSKRLPVRLIFYESFLAQVDAIRRENYFKSSKGKSTIQLMLRETLKK